MMCEFCSLKCIASGCECVCHDNILIKKYIKEGES